VVRRRLRGDEVGFRLGMIGGGGLYFFIFFLKDYSRALCGGCVLGLRLFCMCA
jgi:hypothetical protein